MRNTRGSAKATEPTRPGTGTGTGTGAGGGWSLRVGDFNGDKKPDLALPNNSGSSNSVFLNTST